MEEEKQTVKADPKLVSYEMKKADEKPKETKDLGEYLMNELRKKVVGKKEAISLFSVDLSIRNRRVFDKGKRPRVGRKYVLICKAVDGKKAYFSIEGL